VWADEKRNLVYDEGGGERNTQRERESEREREIDRERERERGERE
jgi:hypothetical protein